MSNFFTDLIGTNTGKSHKRVVSLVASAAVIGGFVADLFLDIKIDPVLVDAVMWLAIMGMGSTVLEKFAPGGKQPRATSTVETKTIITEPQPPDK